MLSTSSGFTQTLDPTGVARASGSRLRSLGANPTLGVNATGVDSAVAVSSCPAATAFATTAGYPTAFGFGEWTVIERKPMPKVDLHPDRWPLHSTS